MLNQIAALQRYLKLYVKANLKRYVLTCLLKVPTDSISQIWVRRLFYMHNVGAAVENDLVPKVARRCPLIRTF